MGWSSGFLAGTAQYSRGGDMACQSLDLLRELLEEPCLQHDYRKDVEALLGDALAKTTCLALKQLSAGGGSAIGSKVLCKFLAGVAEKDIPVAHITSADANTAAAAALRAHPGDDDVLSWTLWLRVMVDPPHISRELQGIVDQQGSASHVCAALWSVASLARVGRLPAAADLPPLILRCIVGPHANDEEVQFRAAQALASLCGAGGSDVPADPGMIRQALETALMRETQQSDTSNGVVEKLLKVSARFQRLHGHVCLLSSPAFASHPDRLRKLLYDIGNGSVKYPNFYGPNEVIQSKAVPAVARVLHASSGDVQELALSALRCLLTSVAELGTEGEEALVEGAAAVVQTLSSCTHLATEIQSSSVFFLDAFCTLRLLAETRLPSVLSQLQSRQEAVAAILQARLQVKDAGFQELVQACKFIAVLTNIRSLLDEMASKGFLPRVVRAACYAIGEGDFDDEETQPCADALIKTALRLLEHYGGQDAVPWELTAMASALGVAGRHFDHLAEKGYSELAMSGARALLMLLSRGADPSKGSFGLLHYASWALSETTTSSAIAREWLANHSETMPALECAVVTLLKVGNCDCAPVDESSDCEARNALFCTVSSLALVQGSSPVVHLMGQHPQSAAVQAAGSSALRTLAQSGGIQLPADNAVMALRRACAACAGNPEVETPACAALGLIMGAR